MRHPGKRVPVFVQIASLVVLVALPYICLRSCTGKVLQYQGSPDGRAIAQVERVGFSAATDADTIAVRLRSRFNPMWEEVFSGADNGASVSVAWIDAANLKITCKRCDKLDRRDGITEDHWKSVSIHYEIQNWFNPQEKSPGN